jgi:hypothetical protein
MKFSFSGIFGSKENESRPTKHESNPLERLTIERTSGGIKVSPFDTNPGATEIERMAQATINESYAPGTFNPVVLSPSEERFMEMFFGTALWSNLGDLAEVVTYARDGRGIIFTFKDPANANESMIGRLTDAVNQAFEFTKKNCK